MASPIIFIAVSSGLSLVWVAFLAAHQAYKKYKKQMRRERTLDVIISPTVLATDVGHGKGVVNVGFLEDSSVKDTM